MTTKKIIPLLAFLSLFISNICLAKDRVIARYDGHDVLKSQITEMIKGPEGKLPDGKKDFDEYDPKMQKQFLGIFIQQKLLVNAAHAVKIDQNPAYKKQLAKLVTQIKAELYLVNYANKKLTPLMARDAYNQYVKKLRESYKLKDNYELQVSHILFSTEAEANKALAEINAGKTSFAKAAKKYSIDPTTKTKGGSLGFIHRGNYVPEFETAVYNLKDGNISSPVKTNYGWHIIKRHSSRKRKIPSFNEIKPNIEHQIKMDIIQQHVAELMQKAKIEIIPQNK